MITRSVNEKDIPEVARLLMHVHGVHSEKRPDIFKRGSRKYTDKELKELFKNDLYRIFVAEDGGKIAGYIFCILEVTENDKSLADRKNLYIDDLCVDPSYQRRGVGTLLLERARACAREEKCNSVTLNVWQLNEGAMKFYEKAGFKVMKTVLEEIL